MLRTMCRLPSCLYVHQAHLSINIACSFLGNRIPFEEIYNQCRSTQEMVINIHGILGMRKYIYLIAFHNVAKYCVSCYAAELMFILTLDGGS